MPSYVSDPALTPGQLVNELGMVAAEVYARLEERLIARIAALASEGLAAPDDLVGRANAVQALSRYAREEISGVSAQLGEAFVQIATEHGMQAALRTLFAIPALPLGFPMRTHAPRAIEALAADLSNRLEVLEQRILRYPQDAYQAIIAGNVPGILAGLDTNEEARRRAVQEFLRRGIDGFTDVTGRVWKIGTYAEMAVRTATLRAWSDSSIATMQAAGVGLVSVVIGNDACAECGAWAGKILSTDGTTAGTYQMPHAAIPGAMVTVRVHATLDDARAAGFQHPNCRCAIVGYLPGLSIAGEHTTYDPQAEADRRAQRERERELRNLKRDRAAATDPDEIADLDRRIRDRQRELREFLDERDMLRQPHREQPWFQDGHPPRREPAPPPTVRPGATTRPGERLTGQRLADLGFNVSFLPEHGTLRTPDVYMDGALWDLKTIGGTGASISRHLHHAASQTRRVVIDVTDSAMPLPAALDRVSHDAERFGLAEVLLLHGRRAYHWMNGEWKE